ncbi:isocitrate lyase/phosphoenolpyruvate mutase family protein [Kutzneria viridogrisea]
MSAAADRCTAYGGAMSDKVIKFRHMHESGLLVLPCAWDLPSARLLAALPEVSAIGTSSAAVAAVLGAADGQLVRAEAMIEAVGAVVRAVDLPVSADLEGGYGDVYGTVRAAIEVGVAGVNLEDTAHPSTDLHGAEQAADRVAQARRAAEDAGVPIVINARTDTWWSGGGDHSEGVDRLLRYWDAGASCLFAPGLPWQELPSVLRELGGAPLNVLAGPGMPSLAELAAAGVRRVSTGSGLARVAWDAARQAMSGLLAGTAPATGLSYEELSRVMAR